MNLFRSEAHARSWNGFGPEAGLLPLKDMLAIFSTSLFTERLNGAYITHRPRYLQERIPLVRRITGNNPFWDPAPGK